MKPLQITYYAALLIVLAVACKDDKDDNGPGPTQPVADCLPLTEATTLTGNQASWTFEYNDKGTVSKINRLNVYGTKSHELQVSAGIVSTSTIPGPAVQLIVNSYVYEGAFLDGHPSSGKSSLVIDGKSDTGYTAYYFDYDSQGRLVTVSEHTELIPGDREWDLLISYNDKDNVTSMYYEITTGPANTGSKISVKAYDDKPTPYAGIPNWKFILNNFSWDNYDPEPLITALSKNNPLDYALNAGTEGEYLRTMQYEYNEQGFPTKRMNTNKNKSGEYTFEQTYTYSCR